MPSMPPFKVSQVVMTKFGKCKIIRYINNKKIKIKFIKTGFKKWVHASALKNGSVSDPNFPALLGIGYVGVGKYSPSKHRKLYSLFTNMYKRCYDEKFQQKHQSYIGCSVVKRWHNFQNFCEDIIKMPNWNTPGFELDKDLRVLGNKIYGPQYCSFVPKNINNHLSVLFTAKGWCRNNYNPLKYNACVPAKYSKGKAVYSSKQKAIKAFIAYRDLMFSEYAKDYGTILHRDILRNIGG